MTDHDKLREAIHRLRAFAPAGAADIAIVCLAAEAVMEEPSAEMVLAGIELLERTGTLSLHPHTRSSVARDLWRAMREAKR